MFDRRCRGYEAVGYNILLPASAVPGWPADVPLPVDPPWKRDYAASVGRLIRDGVDAPLANQFTHVARTVSHDDEEANRARSATEAFLYRRLKTLPETAGQFHVNAELPIPFDGNGHMEVDLLCAEARLVIELDGAQHLDSPEAYRRDRRKDMLLQEHGYFVLRFLAEDVGKYLDTVLDAILRAISHRLCGSQNRKLDGDSTRLTPDGSRDEAADRRPSKLAVFRSSGGGAGADADVDRHQQCALASSAGGELL
jgi:very-short-patch-repair endonuclease